MKLRLASELSPPCACCGNVWRRLLPLGCGVLGTALPRAGGTLCPLFLPLPAGSPVPGKVLSRLLHRFP